MPKPKRASISPSRSRGGGSAGAWILLLCLLVAPGWVLDRLSATMSPWILLSVAGSLNLLTAFLIARDKRRAEAGEQRISEATLHFHELMGGWPGSFLAQQRCRHKTAKGSYQFVFWLIVAVHQAVAIDWLAGGRYGRAAWSFVRAQLS